MPGEQQKKGRLDELEPRGQPVKKVPVELQDLDQQDLDVQNQDLDQGRKPQQRPRRRPLPQREQSFNPRECHRRRLHP